ncbi:MAG: site-2 protease family protein [Bacilli bacterium]|nr:site-2 protease family protein [Bacilli bacterium]
MAWWEILLGIILFIIALGILIGIHELGHLSAAKLFHVYCFDYSIGFGPKIVSTKRSKKHETTWTLRAIPLGGFVSMYGEGMDNEEDSDNFIPPSRSLEGVARYKRAIIVSAGVFLNFILGFVLILLHNGCFDQVSFSFPTVEGYKTAMVCNVSEDIKAQGINNDDKLKLQMDPFAGVFLIQENIKVGDSDGYVLCMSNVVTTTKVDPLLSDSLVIYNQKSIYDVVEDSIKGGGYSDERLASFIKANGDPREEKEIIESLKNLSQEEKNLRYHTECETYYNARDFHVSIDTTKPLVVDKNLPEINANLTFYDEGDQIKQLNLKLDDNGGNKFKDCGIYMKRFFYHYNASECFSETWNQWCGANSAVFKGLGMLLTGQGQVSGPIGIAQMSTNILANFGFERYLYLWGMISCNLAILNLLPFPGLDGWALVVIGYEAITKKQIPTKVKGIISVIGLGLLFLLMFFIIIKDIVGLF